MSKILKMVEAHQTGNRYSEIPQVRFTDTTSQVAYNYSNGLVYEYDCELTLGGRVLAKDEQHSQSSSTMGCTLFALHVQNVFDNKGHVC